ncbi:SURF1 family protein [uncultured Gilvimarinus sp.]|uniref:SURF1 family protein n=1 Tax=uncultured Gilvimarinus sp. TaxID=1689143 RepID=UPI0030EBB96A
MTPGSTARSRLTLTPNRALIALSVVFLPVLIGLGFWQLERAEQKRTVLQQVQQRQAGAPVDLSDTALTGLQPYTRVIARGEFDNKHIWLVDNRQRDGQIGFEVVQIFKLDTQQNILVNRGWLLGDVSRTQLPQVPMLNGTISLFAQLYPVTSHPLLSAKAEKSGWPRVITEVDVSQMAEDVGQPLAEGMLKIDEASPGALRTGWQAVNMMPERHTGYALQWFGLALALVVLTLFANTNLATLWRHKRRQDVTDNKK